MKNLMFLKSNFSIFCILMIFVCNKGYGDVKPLLEPLFCKIERGSNTLSYGTLDVNSPKIPPNNNLQLLLKASSNDKTTISASVTNTLIAIPGDQFQIRLSVNGQSFFGNNRSDNPIVISFSIENEPYRFVCLDKKVEGEDEPITGYIPPMKPAPMRIPYYCRITDKDLNMLVDGGLTNFSPRIKPYDNPQLVLETVSRAHKTIRAVVTNLASHNMRDQFQIKIDVDGKTYVLVNRQDMPIVSTIFVDNEMYRLFCFDDIEE